MSLSIDVEKVSHVLLSDGWHFVGACSFRIDSYEFLQYPDGYDHKKGWNQKDKFGDVMEPFMLHGGGNCGICASGFSFMEKVGKTDFLIEGPLTSILAVRHKAWSK